VRVISGKLKGRQILGYDISGTRPTMDRVKESIFSMIQSYIPEAIVLDLFSGSGNYGIEAISNGSKLVYFNDYNMKCIKVIKDNLTNMKVLDQSKITNFDYKKALNYYKENNIKFDLVFLDPPYKNNIINNILDYLINNDLLNNKALVICELTNREEYLNEKIVLYKEKTYGDKIVLIYKYDN
jgi:16S rRNA (guanine966-N2)-methyltransferase